MYKIVGYYICEIVESPRWLDLGGDKMLSVSGCFGEIYPNLDYCFFRNNQKIQRIEYRKALNLDAARLDLLENEIGELFQKRLAIDGRFLNLSDAQHFYNNYFSKLNCMLVSVSTTEEYFEVLKSEFINYSNSIVDFMNGDIDENELIGFDILGWDIAGFHSFLCNSLHKNLPTAQFNEYMLLNNTFEEVAEFSNQIRGKGEPVEWIPCRIGRLKAQNVS